jgi:hypothetical protein
MRLPARTKKGRHIKRNESIPRTTRDGTRSQETSPPIAKIYAIVERIKTKDIGTPKNSRGKNVTNKIQLI